jgi:hypothetical protein
MPQVRFKATENREWSLRRSCAGRHGVKYRQNGADRRIELFVRDVKGVLQIRWFSDWVLAAVYVLPVYGLLHNRVYREITWKWRQIPGTILDTNELA